MRQLSDIVCNQRPILLRDDATVRQACEQMRDHRAGSVLVTDKAGALVGIFTGRDAVCRVLSDGRTGNETKLADVMTAAPVTMQPGQTAIDALRLMWDGGFRHVPVVDKNKILGVVSRGDFKGDEQDRLDEERSLWEHMR